VKGDRVEIVIDTGGATKTYEVTATRAGRRVEVVNRRGLVEVSEVTRGGVAVRTARFMAGRVVALVEHPAVRRPARQRRGGDQAAGGPAGGNSGATARRGAGTGVTGA
jgi:hypothetical protein